MLIKVWDEVTYRFHNFNGFTVEVWEWTRNFIPHIIMVVNTGIKVKTVLVKRVPDDRMSSSPGRWLQSGAEVWSGYRALASLKSNVLLHENRLGAVDINYLMCCLATLRDLEITLWVLNTYWIDFGVQNQLPLHNNEFYLPAFSFWIMRFISKVREQHSAQNQLTLLTHKISLNVERRPLLTDNKLKCSITYCYDCTTPSPL